MERFTYLNHTSEAKFKAFGKTLEEAFAHAGLAMANIMVDINKVETTTEKEIKVESKQLESLLYDFFDELLYIRDVDGLFISKFENLTVEKADDGYVLKAVALGDDILKYETSGDVKAPTYDDMEILKGKDEWVIQAVVDV